MATSGGYKWLFLRETGQKVRYSNKKESWVDEDGNRVSSQLNERIQQASSSQATSARTEQPDASLSRAFEQLRVDAKGVKRITTSHPTADVQTYWEISPPEDTTSRPFVKKRIRGYDDDDGTKTARSKDLTKGYGCSSNPVADFARGRVIEIVLVPPSEGYTHLTQTNFSQPAKRRFVIIKGSSNEDTGFKALPIKTYNGHGVANEIKSHHAIIYTKRRHGPVPQATPAEMPRRMANGALEAPMQAQAIRVTPYTVTRPLDPMSRLHFFDVHDFDGNVHNIMLYGEVHRDSLAALFYQYQAVWNRLRQHVEPNVAAAHPRAPGVLTVEQFRRIQAEIHAFAHHEGVDPPPLLNAQQEAQLARDQDMRDNWRNLCLENIRAQARQNEEESSEEDEEEENSTEESTSDEAQEDPR